MEGAFMPSRPPKTVASCAVRRTAKEEKLQKKEICWGQHLTVGGCACRESQIDPKEIG